MRRVALPVVGPLPAGGAQPACCRTPAPRRCTPPASPRCTPPRWSSATPSCRTAAATRSFTEGLGWLSQIGLFVMLGLLLSPSRIDTTRSGRRWSAGPADGGGPAAVGVGEHASGSARPGRTWRSCPGRGCAARCPSCWPRSRCRAGVTAPTGCSTSSSCWSSSTPWSPARRCRGWPGASGSPSPGGARPRHRVGAAGAARRRPAADPDHQALADARRRGGRAAAARGRLGRAHRARRRDQGARRPHRAAQGRRPPRGHAAQVRGRPPRSGCGRCPRAAGWRTGSSDAAPARLSSRSRRGAP